jgi:uncharacterized oligopeptide transporter (OPT) family protein
MQTLRSILAVIAGYLLFAVSAFLVFKLFNQPPHAPAPIWFAVVATLFGMLFALLGGYLAGLIAGRKPLGHAVAVAAVLVLGASVSLVATLGKGGVVWSQLAALVLMAPSAMAGGWLRRRRAKP